jgi:hypothetical protein
MKYYHYSSHKFIVGEIVEARLSFPFPDAYAWASTDYDSILDAKGDGYMFEVEPIGHLEPSPYHEHAVRSTDGFKVVREI